MGHKRKRQNESENTRERTEERSSKVQLVESEISGKPTPQNTTEQKKTKNARKQLRSERKSKKIETAKQNAARKLRLAGENAADGIAGGEDFVPLSSDGALELLDQQDRSVKEKDGHNRPKSFKKGKGSSPRSLRKAAQAAKAMSLTTEEYGAELVQSSGHDNAVADANSKAKSAPRFICFVGNLPYSCTTEQIQAHFRKLNPKSIRHPADKQTGSSKGFAFLEFHDYDKMKTCLKLYHHSIFEPERTAKLQEEAGAHASDLLPRIGDKKNKGRMINVELTAGGGGGKSGDRRKKIHEKNVKLEKQRAKARIKAMQKEKEDAKKAKKDTTAPEGAVSGANGVLVEGDSRGNVHPSRLQRVKR